MKHILDYGDRVQDSRNPLRKGYVKDTDIVEHGGNESYGLDFAEDGMNGWSDWPYSIWWDGETGATWVDSEYAEPEGWPHAEPVDEPDDEGNMPTGEVPPVNSMQVRTGMYATPENINPPTLTNLTDAVDLSDFISDGGFVVSRLGEESEEPYKVGDTANVFSFTLNTPIVDAINPDYYNGTDVADFIDRHGLDFFLGNVVKYVSRAGKKGRENTIQDLKKAQWYLESKIARLEGSDD